jgi:hypothetical protein
LVIISLILIQVYHLSYDVEVVEVQGSRSVDWEDTKGAVKIIQVFVLYIVLTFITLDTCFVISVGRNPKATGGLGLRYA